MLQPLFADRRRSNEIMTCCASRDRRQRPPPRPYDVRRETPEAGAWCAPARHPQSPNGSLLNRDPGLPSLDLAFKLLIAGAAQRPSKMSEIASGRMYKSSSRAALPKFRIDLALIELQICTLAVRMERFRPPSFILK